MDLNKIIKKVKAKLSATQNELEEEASIPKEVKDWLKKNVTDMSRLKFTSGKDWVNVYIEYKNITGFLDEENFNKIDDYLDRYEINKNQLTLRIHVPE